MRSNLRVAIRPYYLKMFNVPLTIAVILVEILISYFVGQACCWNLRFTYLHVHCYKFVKSIYHGNGL